MAAVQVVVAAVQAEAAVVQEAAAVQAAVRVAAAEQVAAADRHLPEAFYAGGKPTTAVLRQV